ncbi:hypothetical protein Bbelb_388080 [Branchiostoma belcheri]|nr:hypothetical protein Bbelb_388080 [Branchiostoma belcheri]
MAKSLPGLRNRAPGGHLPRSLPPLLGKPAASRAGTTRTVTPETGAVVSQVQLGPRHPPLTQRNSDFTQHQVQVSFTASGGTTSAFGRDTLGGGHQQAGR